MKRDDLHDLIKSLASNEKRYFKLFAKQHGEESSPKYLDLFDALEGMESYDVKELQDRIHDKRILTFLNQEKNFLKGRIMEALRAYRDGKSVDSELYGQMQEMDILYEKGLYNQCLKQLKRSKSLAKTYDRFGILIDILSLEQKLTIELRPQNMLGQMESIHEEQQEVLALHANLIAYQSLWRSLLAVFRQEGYRGAGTRLPAMIDLSLLNNEDQARSFAAKHFFRLAKSVVARMQGDFNDAVAHYEALIAMWKSQDGRIAEAPMQYLLVVANLLNMQHKRGDYSSFQAFIQELKELKLDSFGDKAERFQNQAHLEMLYFMNCQLPLGQLNGYAEMEQEIKKGLVTYQGKVNAARRLVILHNAMVANFFMENWEGAIRWWVQIDQDEDAKSVRREIFDFSRIMQLVLQYERGKYEWLQDLARNHRRSLERGDRMSEFFAIVLQGVQQLSKTDDTAAHQPVLAGMETELRQLMQTIDERNILGFKEILLWLEWHGTKDKRFYEILPKP